MRENIWKNIKLGFKTNKLAVVGAAAIILLALISIFAFLYPVDPNAISATERLNAPSMAHLFGTDDMGRDYLARCIYGGRASLLVGFLSMVLSTALGVIIGSISGFVGGTVDAVLMRLVDALIKADKDFEMFVLPKCTHGFFGESEDFFEHKMWRHFARLLLHDNSADSDVDLNKDMIKDDRRR